MEAVLNGPNGRFVLGPAPLTIGRTPDNQLAVNDIKASSHHAEIRPNGQGYTIVDLGSTNGTFVNGQQLDRGMPRQLNPGDTIRIGDTSYTYQASGGSDSQYAATAFANPSQGPFQGNAPSGYDPTVAASSSPSPSTAYGANAMQGYQSSSPDYQQYNQGAQPPYQGGQSYPPSPSPNPAYGQPSYTPPPPPAYPAYNQPDPMSYPPPPPINQMNQPVGGMMNYGGVPSLPPLPQQAPQKKGRSTGMIVLIVVILVVLIGGSFGFLLVHNNQVKIDNTNATATTNTGNHLTATAQVFASQTAVANTHATATATVVTSNPNPYPPNTGTLALYDPLTDNSQGYQWNESTHCAFTGGSYHVSEVTANNIHYCMSGASTYSDFAYNVVMTVTKGDCGGLIFRSDANSNNFYDFDVCQEGYYDLYLFSNNQAKAVIQLKNSSLIKTGLNQSNIIGVVARGQSITLYVNNQSLGTITDSSFSSGSVGLAATDLNGSTDVAYTFAKLWTL